MGTIGLLSLWTVAGCGDGGKQTGLADSATPEAALGRLPASTQATFDAWKAKPVKSCDLDEAFPGYQAHGEGNGLPGPRGLDASVMSAKLGGKPLISGANGTLALLTSATGHDFSHSEERRVTVEGQGTPADFHARLEAGGGRCTISVFGQVVYDVPFFAKVVVGAQVDPAAQARTGMSRGLWHSAGVGDEVEVLAEVSLDEVDAALAPPSAAIARERLAAALGVGAADLADLVDATAALPAAFQIDGAPHCAWIDPRASALLGPLKELLERTAGKPLLLRGFFQAASLTRSEEVHPELFTVEIDTALAATGATEAVDSTIDTKVTVSAVRGAGWRAPSSELTADCADSRIRGGLSVLGAKQINSVAPFSGSLATAARLFRSPQLQFAERPCAPLGGESFAKALAKSDKGRAAVATMIGSTEYVGLEWRAVYQGWDELAVEMIHALLAGSGDLDAAINPGTVSNILSAGAAYRVALHDAVGSGTLTPDNEEALTTLAYTWAINPSSGYQLDATTWDYRLKADIVSAVGKQLQKLTGCPMGFATAARAFERDVTQMSSAWTISCK